MRFGGLQNFCRHRLAAQRRLKRMIQALGQGFFKATHTFVPCVRVGRHLVASGRGLEFPSEGVGVERRQSFTLQKVTADRTLTGSVYTGEDVENGACINNPSPLLPCGPIWRRHERSFADELLQTGFEAPIDAHQSFASSSQAPTLSEPPTVPRGA